MWSTHTRFCQQSNFITFCNFSYTGLYRQHIRAHHSTPGFLLASLHARCLQTQASLPSPRALWSSRLTNTSPVAYLPHLLIRFTQVFPCYLVSCASLGLVSGYSTHMLPSYSQLYKYLYIVTFAISLILRQEFIFFQLAYPANNYPVYPFVYQQCGAMW